MIVTRYTGPSSSEGRRVYTSLPAADSFGALEMWLNLNANKSEAANALHGLRRPRVLQDVREQRAVLPADPAPRGLPSRAEPLALHEQATSDST